jgi:hypothetical protein
MSRGEVETFSCLIQHVSREGLYLGASIRNPRAFNGMRSRPVLSRSPTLDAHQTLNLAPEPHNNALRQEMHALRHKPWIHEGFDSVLIVRTGDLTRFGTA